MQNCCWVVRMTRLPLAGRRPAYAPPLSLPRRFLQHEALRARLQRAVDVLGAQIHGEDQHARLRTLLDDAPRRLHAVELRHGDVHDDDVRPQTLRLGHRLATVTRNRNHLHVSRFEQRAKTVADDRVIVGEQYGHRHVRPPPLTWYSTST